MAAAFQYELAQLRAAVRVQDEYIRQQTAKLREMQAYCRNQADRTFNADHPAEHRAYRDMAGRVDKILGLVVGETEEL